MEELSGTDQKSPVVMSLLRIALPLCLLPSALCAGHGVPTLVTLTPDLQQLALLGEMQIGQLDQFGQITYGTDPGFGVSSPTAGPPAGTQLYLELLGGLAYWDGTALAETTVSGSIVPPQVDSHNNENPLRQLRYAIDATTGPQQGMFWSAYPGVPAWDAHGAYSLSAQAPAGIYGIPARLNSPSFEPSEPFVIPLVVDPNDTWNLAEEAAGVDALQQILQEPVEGDYNGDGMVDLLDYDQWHAEFGGVHSIYTADGNGDAVVDAADYVLWRNARTTAAGPAAVVIPEPTTVALASLVLAGAALRFYRHR